ncbi:MAG: hypothetical protein QNK03_02695 [Myxococcota bacterium]|nr:hypothetical protein [Myxococcota bacterium]
MHLRLFPRPAAAQSTLLPLVLAAALLAGTASTAVAVSSYATSAADEVGSSTGAAVVALGVPDYLFVNDAGLPFGGTNTDVFDPGEATVLAFDAPLRDIPGQEDLVVSAFVGGAGATDDAQVQVEVSEDGVIFVVVGAFSTGDARTSYPLIPERAHESVKHFAIDFAGAADFVTHVRISNLSGTAEGLRLDAVEGLHPDLVTSAGFEIRFERFRGPTVERFRVRIKNLADPGGVGVRSFRIDKPAGANLENTLTTLFGLDGDFICVENCIPDNGPSIPHSLHEWSEDGVSVAPAGVGLEPGRQAAHDRLGTTDNFDLDTAGSTFLAGFSFTVWFTDGSSHTFDWDNDVVGTDVTGMLYQKYLVWTPTPAVSGPHLSHYYEFLGQPACSDGEDNDGDGIVDLADPGCDDASDDSEQSEALPCDDGEDNDGDGWTDYRPDASGDPGCFAPDSATESPQCQDGIDNDTWPGTDFDGGESILGVGNGDPNGADPQCTAFWDDKEGSSCGLGAELALLLPLLAGLRGRARRRSRGLVAEA